MTAIDTRTRRLDTAAIRRILPHRYPMLLVDAVDEVVPGQCLVARKAITANEPWYARGDVGQNYPKTLLVESWCQAAGVLATIERPNPDVLAGQIMLFGGISGITFRGDAVPGDVVEHRVEVVRALSDTVIVAGSAHIGERELMTVSRVVMAFRPAETLRDPAAKA